MILRSGIDMSSMVMSETLSSRNSFSSDETNNEGEHSLVIITQHSLDSCGYYQSKYYNSSSKQHEYYGYEYNAYVWLAPRFCVTIGHTSSNTIRLGLIPTMFQNPLYTSAIMVNLPPFRSLPGPLIGSRQNIGNISIGLIYPNMLRPMPVVVASYTNESLATFRQQLEESYHELLICLLIR